MPLKKKRTKKKLTKKKAIKRKVAKKRPIKKRKTLQLRQKKKKLRVIKKSKENIIGIVTHYFPKVRAAVIKLKAPLAIGDTVKIKGHTTDFTQNVTSIQIDRVTISLAKKGQEIGLLVNSRARQHDAVYKV